MTIPSKLYDALKWVAMVLLPALATFYFVMAGIWNLPYAGEVVATITATDTLLGAILGISSATYKKSDARFDGTLTVIKNDPSLINQLEINTSPENLGKQKEMTLRIDHADIPMSDDVIGSPPRS